MSGVIESFVMIKPEAVESASTAAFVEVENMLALSYSFDDEVFFV